MANKERHYLKSIKFVQSLDRKINAISDSNNSMAVNYLKRLRNLTLSEIRKYENEVKADKKIDNSNIIYLSDHVRRKK